MDDELLDLSVCEARVIIRERATKGTTCVCCDQNVKIYKRPLNHVPAAAMLALYRDAYRDWAHMPTVMRSLPMLAAQGGYSVLGKHWGLISEQVEERRDDGGRAGWWRMTDLGVRFVLGAATVPKFARIYNGEALGLTGPPITIRDALGTRFDYQELLAG